MNRDVDFRVINAPKISQCCFHLCSTPVELDVCSDSIATSSVLRNVEQLALISDMLRYYKWTRRICGRRNGLVCPDRLALPEVSTRVQKFSDGQNAVIFRANILCECRDTVPASKAVLRVWIDQFRNLPRPGLNLEKMMHVETRSYD